MFNLKVLVSERLLKACIALRIAAHDIFRADIEIFATGPICAIFMIEQSCELILTILKAFVYDEIRLILSDTEIPDVNRHARACCFAIWRNI